MSSKSSCPECGPRGDVIPTLKTDEEPPDLTPKPHYSCFKSADASRHKPEEEVESTTSGKSEKEVDDHTSCEKPKEEAENTSCEEDQVEDIQAAVQEDDDGKQKRKELEHSSLFNIADAKSHGDVDRMNDAPDAPSSDMEKLVQPAQIRSEKLSP